MKEHPILFKPALIQAIIEDRKTMTRRVLKKPPPDGWDGISNRIALAASLPIQPGDVIWVKEKHRIEQIKHGWRVIYSDGTHQDVPMRYLDWHDVADKLLKYNGGWRSPLFMFAWASRLHLPIASVRVERLKEIPWGDVQREGIDFTGSLPHPISIGRKTDAEAEAIITHVARHEFATLWDSINAGRGYPWKSNPWVAVYEFERGK